MANLYCDFTLGDEGNAGTQLLPLKYAVGMGSSTSGKSLAAGDSMLHKCGETWREQLTVPSSGESGNPITYGAYGTGAAPIIAGSDAVTGFGTAQNLIANPGMESWTADDPDSWPETEGAGCSVTQETVNVHSGSSACKIVMGAVNNLTYFQQAVTILASKAYHFSMWQYSTGGTWTVGFMCQGGASNNYWLQSDLTWAAGAYAFAIPSAGSYTELTKDFTMPAGATGVLIQVKRNSAANQTLYTDDFALNPQHIYTKAMTTEPKQVFQSASRLTKGSSATALTDGQWFWVGNVLYIRSDSGTPANITASQRDYCADVNGQDYITLNGLTCQEANYWGISSSGAADTTAITGCTSTRNFFGGIMSQSTVAWTNVTCTNNTVNWNGGHGILVHKSSHHWTISGNTSHNNSQLYDTTAGYNGLLKFSAGIRAWCDDDSVTDLVIENNTVYANGKLAGGTYVDPTAGGGVTGAGIWFDTVQTGSVIRYNHVYDNQAAGIKLEFAWGHTVAYNIVTGTVPLTGQVGHGILIGAYSSTYDVKNNALYNNVCYGNDAGIGVWGRSDAGANGCTGNLVKNNISVGNTRWNLDARWGGENDGTTGSGNVYIYNCFGAEANDFIQWGNGVYKDTYDAWETAYGGGTNSVEADPLFVGAATGDFHLQPASPCRDAGVDVSLTQDYAGHKVPFGTAPDIGAYEFAAGGIATRRRRRL